MTARQSGAALLLSLSFAAAACGSKQPPPAVMLPPMRATAEPRPAPPACVAPMIKTRAAGCVRIVALALGEQHRCALLGDGRVLCWGPNGSGELGDGTGHFRAEPTLVSNIDDAVELKATDRRACARHKDGKVSCWGSNYFGETDANRSLSPRPPDYQRGLSDETDPDFMIDNIRYVPSPVPLPEPAVAIALGFWHNCAAFASGKVSCWGRNTEGALGDTQAGGFRMTTFALAEPAVELSAGTHHTCARSASGHVECWGSNSNAQLGDKTPGPTPRRVMNLDAATALESQDNRTCARMANGTYVCFGDAGDCGTDKAALPPGPFTAVGKAKKLSLGSCHHCVLRDDAKVDCWDTFRDGLNGSSHHVDVPDASDIESKADQSCILALSGEMWCWGSDIPPKAVDFLAEPQ